MTTKPKTVDELLNPFIEKWCGDNAPHLLDSDENDGERLRADINRLLVEARIDELKTLMAKHSRTYTQTVTDSSGEVYLNDSHGFISKYETQERILALQASSKESGSHDKTKKISENLYESHLQASLAKQEQVDG